MDKEDVVYISTVEYFLAIKKNEILTFATTWMELEGIMLCMCVYILKEFMLKYIHTHKHTYIHTHTHTHTHTYTYSGVLLGNQKE